MAPESPWSTLRAAQAARRFVACMNQSLRINTRASAGEANNKTIVSSDNMHPRGIEHPRRELYVPNGVRVLKLTPRLLILTPPLRPPIL